MPGTSLFSDEWIASCNDALGALAAPEATSLTVVERVTGAPADVHDVVSLVADAHGVRVEAGEATGASAWLTVAFDDAAALNEGRLEPADAIATGRLRVRGDLRAVVDAVGLLAQAHGALRARPREA